MKAVAMRRMQITMTVLTAESGADIEEFEPCLTP